MTLTTFLIPGLPGPVFAPAGRPNPRTIDAQRQLVQYKGSYPTTYFDVSNWVAEPWNSRVVALNGDVEPSSSLSVLRDGADKFEIMTTQKRGPGSPARLYVFPRQKMTLALTFDGNALKVSEDGLVPWLSPSQLAAEGIHGIYRVLDAPSLSAIIVVDTERHIHILTDQGQWVSVRSSNVPDNLSELDAGDAGVLLASNQLGIVIQKDPAHSGHFIAKDISPEASRTGTSFLFSKVRGQVLMHRGPSALNWHDRWQRLGVDGLEDIPGGNIDLPRPDLFPNGRIIDLPTLGKTLIEGHRGLYLYNGKSIVPVQDGDKSIAENLPKTVDLPSIGHVLVSTANGLFELTREGKLARLDMPFPTEGLPQQDMVDWPSAHLALISTKRGIFSLDANLVAKPVAGGDLVGAWLGKTFTGVNPGNGDMLITGQSGIFQAVNEANSADQPCQATAVKQAQLPTSDLCLSPIPGTDAKSIGFAIGGMVEAPKNHGVLIDTVGGLFLLSPDNKVTTLQTRTGQFTRDLANLPGTDSVLAIGARDDLVVSDLSIQPIATNQHSEILDVFPTLQSALIFAQPLGDGGKNLVQKVQLISVRDGKIQTVDAALRRGDYHRFVDAPWFGTVVVQDQHQLALLDNNGNMQPMPFSSNAAAQQTEVYAKFAGISDSMAFFGVERFKTIFIKSKRWMKLTADRQIIPVDGLPPEVFVFDTFDPGKGNVLLGTNMGVFEVNQDGTARRFEGVAPRHTVRTFGRDFHRNAVLTGGDDGMFQIDPDTHTVTPVGGASSDEIGSVAKIQEIPFGGFDIVQASKGAYEFGDKGLSASSELLFAGGAAKIRSFPDLKRVLIQTRDDRSPMVLELARKSPNGACSRPLGGV
jgi:hypothetical protein